MNKILSIVISSKNNEICLLNLIKQIISNSNFLTSFDLYIINDASTTDYSKVEEYINKNPEIKYYVNKTPQGKVRSIVNHTKFLSSQYLVFIDDKDKILPLFWESIQKLVSNNNVFVGYLAFKNMNIIANKISSNITYYQYYYLQANEGDLIFFYPRRIYQKFSIPIELKNLVINDELVINQYIFNEPLTIIENLPLIVHDYSMGHLTKNLFTNKFTNYQLTQWCSYLILKNNPCFVIIIARLFWLWFTRKKEKPHFSKIKFRFFYLVLYFSGCFVFIKYLYKRKIENLIKK